MKKSLLLSFILLTFFAFSAHAQERVVSGTVTDADAGDAIPGVNVIIKGTTTGATTDIDGKYQVKVPNNDAVLVFSYVGYKSQEITVGAQSKIDIRLEADSEVLEEVVVTAAGIERDKKKLGYAVQQVKSDELLQAQEANVVNALNAKVAGVQITSAEGSPGAASRINIRGNSSLTGNNTPLFVIDGLPISESTTGGPGSASTAGVANSNRAVDLNPEDIADITVLKGGAATALYGLRAANGAIIITTKRGSANSKPKVTLSSTITLNEHNGITPLNDRYAQGISDNYLFPAGGAFASWGPDLATLVFDPNTANPWDKNGAITTALALPNGTPIAPYDNVGDFYQTGVSTNNYLSVTGGNGNATYFASIGHLDQEGITPNATFQRTTAKVNTDFRLTDKAKFSSGITYTRSGGNRIQRGSNTSGVMLGLLRTPPSFDNSNGFGSDAVDTPESYIFPDGTQRTYRAGGGYDNPFWVVNRIPHTDEVNRLIAYGQLNYAVTDWLDVTYRVGNDFYSDRRSQGFAVNSRTLTGGQVWELQIFNQDFNSDLIITADKDFNDDLTGTLIVGHNYFRSHNQTLYVQGDGLVIPDFYNLSNASSISTQDNESILKRHGAFFDAGISYKDMLFVNITGRNDWSSTLPEENNSFFYPSFNVGFAFSELMGENKILSFGKLRASYAIVGNDAPVYATDTYFASSVPGFTYSVIDGWTNGLGFPAFGGTSAFTTQNTLGNSELKPERSSTFEIGADLRFFDNKLTLDVTYFDISTTDQIVAVSLSNASGFGSIFTNAGDVSNRGLELVLGATPYKKGGFAWTTNLAFTAMENTVEELAPGIENIFLGGFTGTASRAVQGEPYGTLFGGTWQKLNGQVVIGDDGFPVASGTTDVIGDPNPDWTAGLRNTLTYKDLTLSFLIDIRSGGDMWNGTKGALTFFGASELTEDFRDRVVVFDGVLADGTPNTQEVVLTEDWFLGNGGGFGDVDEHFVESTSWVRLRDVSLNYNIPKKLFDGWFAEGGSITLFGRNLWMWTAFDGNSGRDPEVSLTNAGGQTNAALNAAGLEYFNGPNNKSYGATLRLTF
ncbi:MAG: SusC/RagA family TonB-linked outer membrane protein [Flammeovirgaceae bacterium]